MIQEMQKIDVLQLVDGLNIGGAEKLLLDLSMGLRSRGFRVGIGYSSPGPLVGEFSRHGFPLTRLPRLFKIDPLLLGGMIRLMRRERPYIVHTHLFKSDFHGRIAARIAEVPVVVSTLHSVDRWARLPFLGRVYGGTARFADRLIAVSDDVRNFHLTYTGVPGDKVVTIQNGVDLPRYLGAEAGRRDLRKELGVDDAQFLIGIVGRLTPPKDHATFLKAASIIYKKYPAARFLVVGDGPLRADLEKQSKELGLDAALTFTGFRDDVPGILSAIDVLVISSRWEGLPVVLLEAMAAARPIVAASVGGIPEVVQDDETALLVETGNESAMAEACLRLAFDASLRKKMGQAGFNRVRSRYSLETMLDQTALLYADLLKSRGLDHAIPPQVGKLTADAARRPERVSQVQA